MKFYLFLWMLCFIIAQSDVDQGHHEEGQGHHTEEGHDHIHQEGGQGSCFVYIISNN